MNPIAEFLLVAAIAILSGLAFCTIIGGAWLAIHRHHQADEPPPWPENRDFEDIEVGTAVPSGPSGNFQSPICNNQLPISSRSGSRLRK